MPRSIARLCVAFVATFSLVPIAPNFAEAPFDFDAKFHIGATPSDVSIRWQTALGCEDTLEKSMDLVTWMPLAGPIYGIGQEIAIAVPEAASTPPPGGPPGDPPKFYDFLFHKYATGLVVASWRGSDGSSQCKRLGSQWTTLNLPSLYFFFQDDTTPQYHLMIASLNAASGSVAPPDTTLPPAEADKFAKLNDSYDKIVENLNQGPPPNGGTQTGTASQVGIRGLFRVKRRVLDTDDDRLTDYQELSWNLSSPFDPDSDDDNTIDLSEDFDGDGLLTYQELAQDVPPNSSSQTYLGPETLTVQVDGQDYKALKFRSLPGIAHNFTYRVRSSTDQISWTDVNHYFHKVGNPTPVGSGSLAEWMTVRAPTPVTGPTTFLSLYVTPPWPPYDLAHETVTLQNLRAHSDATFVRLLPIFPAAEPLGPDWTRRIFDEDYNRDADSPWARWCWTNQIDLTGVAWDDYKNGNDPYRSACEAILISPRHVLMSAHYAREYATGRRTPAPIGEGLAVFHDRHGKRVERRILAHKPTPAEPMSYDIVIGLLDRDVPEGVRVYKLLDPMGTGSTSVYSGILPGARALLTIRERQCFSHRIKSLYSGNSINFEIDPGVPSLYRIPPRDGQPEGAAVSGDSGNPAFIFVKGEPILISHFVSELYT